MPPIFVFYFLYLESKQDKSNSIPERKSGINSSAFYMVFFFVGC